MWVRRKVLVLSFVEIKSGHDMSDGGLITCLLEMAFAGNCGFNVQIEAYADEIQAALFAEEVGWVLEVDEEHAVGIIQTFIDEDVMCYELGKSVPEDKVR